MRGIINAVLRTGALGCALCACALPPKSVETSGFVTDPELNAVGITREGLGYMKQSRFVDAELSFRQSLYFFPTADNLKENLALALSGGDQIDDAVAIFTQLAKKYPYASRYYINLGETYFFNKRYPEARNAFNHALELAWVRSDYGAAATVLRSLSVLEFRIGNEQAALCRSQEALALKPEAGEAIRHGRLLLTLNRFTDVGTTMSTYLTAGPALLIDIDRLLALAAYGMKQYDSAASYAQHILDSQTADFDSRDEVELIAYIALRRKNDTMKDVPTSEEVEKLTLFSLGPSDYEQLYWPPNFVEDFHTIQKLIAANA